MVLARARRRAVRCYVLQAVYACAPRSLDSALAALARQRSITAAKGTLASSYARRRLYAATKQMLVALESLDREAESVPKIGGGVPRGFLYPPGKLRSRTAGRTGSKQRLSEGALFINYAARLSCNIYKQTANEPLPRIAAQRSIH